MTPLISSTWQRQQKRIAMQFIEEKPPWSNNLCCWLTITIFSWTFAIVIFRIICFYSQGNIEQDSLVYQRTGRVRGHQIFWHSENIETVSNFFWICTICADIERQMMWLVRRGFAFCGTERISPDETSGKVFLFALGLRLGKLEGLGCHI